MTAIPDQVIAESLLLLGDSFYVLAALVGIVFASSSDISYKFTG